MTGKQLKNSILQLAIQGKLVPQDPHDEPASELLKRIRKEKEQLVKEGKLKKKDLESTPIAEEDKPFEIPESWEWVRIGMISTIKGGKRIPVGYTFSESKTTHVYIRVSDMKNDTISLDDLHYVDDEVFDKIKNYIITTNDLYITIVGATIGKCGIIPDSLNNQNLTENAARIIPHQIFKKYLLQCLKTEFCQNQFIEKTNQVGVQKMALTRFCNTLIPLPPLSEQHRIVEKIEELMPLVEEYDKAQSELDKLNESLPEQLKKSILQQAIMGKLVPQDPNDEPASELLKRIHKEKENLVKSGSLKKKDLITTPISDDEKPFDIPESWEWVSLESVIYQVGNKYNQVLSSEIQKEGLLPVVSQSQKLVDGYTDQIAKKIEDIPLVLFGDHTRNVKYIDFPFVIGADGVKLLKPIILSARFLYFWTLFSSSNLRDRGYARHYTLLKEVPFPLPPLPEQHRIVAKIEELFSII